VTVDAADLPGAVPDLRGLSAREATQKLAHLGLIARIAGDGFVVFQDPPAGTPVETVTVCSLTLERSPARLLASALTP
jgi:beta-lactam-binding protein with PASTA domain